MSKIICDICGTTYPDTADCCPICGCSKDAAAEFLGEEITVDDIPMEEEKGAKASLFSSKKNREIFDFDAVEPDMPEPPGEDDWGGDDSFEDEEEPEEAENEDQEPSDKEEERGHNVFAVILLTVLIIALLAAAAFVYFRYFQPNQTSEDAAQSPTATQTVPEVPAATTETVGIPCQMLILTSGTAKLSEAGQMFLLHVQPTPEDTTDVITFTSADESVATVTADGKVTAVGEGETVIYISCGSIQTTCPVVVNYEEETTPVTEATKPAPQETKPADAKPAETKPAETKPSQSTGLKNVKLKLKRTDISLGVYYEYQLLLDCNLEQNEVQWSSEHPHIASVDKNGVVKALKSGTTSIIAKYGDQEVSCIVRCHY